MANIDLLSLFNSVTSSLQNNQDTLNQADSYNGNHGDNMVEIFEVITTAMKEKSNAAPSDQLAYASQLLKQKESGTAQVYAEGFGNAAQKFLGKDITQSNVLDMIQTIVGGAAPAKAEPEPQQQDMLGGLLNTLGSLIGGKKQQSTTTTQQDDGLDVGDLLNAGMAYMSAKQQGQSDTQAIIGALMNSSPLNQTSHRQQSGQIVLDGLLSALGSLNK